MITPTQDSVQIAMRAFLLAVLPDGVDVLVGVQNRVPEPSIPGFVVMVPIRYTRLRTNVDSLEDVKFTGSIAPAVSPATGGVMTVTAVDFGEIKVGATVFGVGVTDATKITAQTSGTTGGIGVYAVSQSQTVGSETLASGAQTLEQGTEVVVQLDFHTADNSAADLAMTVSTVLRDEVGVSLFEAQGLGVVPLYADDPVYRPWISENQQYEWRWSLDVHLQVNPIVTWPQQFADSVQVLTRDVSAEFPPT